MTNKIEELKEKIAAMQNTLRVLEQLEEEKTDVEKEYRDAYGHFPETSGFAMTDGDVISWDAFQKGYNAAKKSKIKPFLINCVLEGNPPNGYSHWNEWFRELGSKGILHNLKISSIDFKEKVEEPTKPMDEVVERLTKKYQAQKLYNRLFELGYEEEDCDVIVDLVEDWLPEPQNASGSQNVDTELLVDGFNDCVRKMKEMLR
jgi:hypothetical protein